jgi:serine/threonine-protein kinase
MGPWTVPGFAEERQIGSGGSGRVVAAVHLASSTRVAIKYLSPRLLADPRFLDAFRSEARILRSLSVPQVARLLDYMEAPGQGAAIIMELVDGVSLHDMITRQGPTTPESALAVMKGSLLGLSAAHALGIVHGDYKPENVLVDRSGQSRLTDFGVAVRAGRNASAGGTPLYMAPEQWNGVPAAPAADIYAVTAVFFECLTGRTPFSGGLGQLAALHAAAVVPVEMIDEPLRDLITRGMAKEPAARPASAAAFVAELETTAAQAYGADWEARGHHLLAERAAALLLLLLPHGAAAVAGGTGIATTDTVLPGVKTAAAGKLAGLSGLQAAALFAGVFAVVAGTLVGVSAARGQFSRQPALSGSSRPTALPGIAYATTTAVYARTGTAAPDKLASLPAGMQASQFAWSYDGQWLGWFSGPAGKPADQVHVTNARTRVTHTWPCANCTAGAFSGGQLLVNPQSGSAGGTLTALPEDGGPATTVTLSGPVVPASASGAPEVIASTPHDASVLFFRGSELGGALYEATPSGAAKPITQRLFPIAPGGDRDYGGTGLIAISPDKTILAYGGNGLGGDTGEGSDWVTVVNLVTGAVTSAELPVDKVQPLRVSAVWVDSSHGVHATAWHQPGTGNGAVPVATVTPHQYRLDNGKWVDAGPANVVAAGGPDGWTAVLEQPAEATVSVTNSQEPGQLVADLGTRQVALAANVTAFAWTPA